MIVQLNRSTTERKEQPKPAVLKKRLTFISDGIIHIIPFQEITCVEAEGNYATIYTTQNKHVLSRTLKWVESRIHSEDFFRIHSKYLVNLSYARQLDISNRTLVLSDNKIVSVARAKLKEIKSLLIS